MLTNDWIFHRVACEVVSSHTVLKINLVEGRFHMGRSDRYPALHKMTNIRTCSQRQARECQRHSGLGNPGPLGP